MQTKGARSHLELQEIWLGAFLSEVGGVWTSRRRPRFQSILHKMHILKFLRIEVVSLSTGLMLIMMKMVDDGYESLMTMMMMMMMMRMMRMMRMMVESK